MNQLNKAQIENATETMTARKLANMAVGSASFDAFVAHYAAIAFHGKQLIAAKDSMIHKVMLELVSDRTKFNSGKDEGDKFQGLSKLQQAIGRYIKGAAHISDKRVSLKTTGKADDFSIALVTVKADAPKASGNTKPATGKGKTGGDRLAGFKSLEEILKLAADAYGIEAVKTAAAKLA